MDAYQLFVAELLLLPPLMIALAGILFARAWKKGTLRDRLAYMVFVPKRRNHVMISFSVMMASYWTAGIVGALGAMGVLSDAAVGVTSALTFLSGSVAFMAMTVLGLAVAEPGAENRLLVDQPEAFAYSLGIVDRNLKR
jgi:hypothetical protein